MVVLRLVDQSIGSETWSESEFMYVCVAEYALLCMFAFFVRTFAIISHSL